MSSGTHLYSGDPANSAKDAVRFLIPDHEEGAMLLSDEEIEWLLNEESQNVRLATARALETIATSEALVLKKVELLDFKTDGPALARVLIERAGKLRAEEELDEAQFDWAEMVTNEFTYDERIFKELLRDS